MQPATACACAWAPVPTPQHTQRGWLLTRTQQSELVDVHCLLGPALRRLRLPISTSCSCPRCLHSQQGLQVSARARDRWCTAGCCCSQGGLPCAWSPPELASAVLPHQSHPSCRPCSIGGSQGPGSGQAGLNGRTSACHGHSTRTHPAPPGSCGLQSQAWCSFREPSRPLACQAVDGLNLSHEGGQEQAPQAVRTSLSINKT